MMKPFIPEQQELTFLKLQYLQNQTNCEVFAQIVERKDAEFRTAMEEYNERMTSLLYLSWPPLTCPLYTVNTKYRAVKKHGEELLVKTTALLKERDPEIIEETDRIMHVRKYFPKLAEWEDALEIVGGDVEELQRQGIEKPEPDENAQEGDLRNLEELEIACRTVEEQLEYNNNRDESVVRSYEEKKKTVSAVMCLKDVWWTNNDWLGWKLDGDDGDSTK